MCRDDRASRDGHLLAVRTHVAATIAGAPGDVREQGMQERCLGQAQAQGPEETDQQAEKSEVLYEGLDGLRDAGNSTTSAGFS